MKSSNTRTNFGTEIRRGTEIRPDSSDDAGEVRSDDSLLLFGEGVRHIVGVYGIEGHGVDADEDLAVAGLGNGEFPDGDVSGSRREDESLHFVDSKIVSCELLR